MITMNKGLQIFLLVLLFFVCGVVGYFAGEVLLDSNVSDDKGVEQVVEDAPVQEPEVVYSTIPVIEAVYGPELNSDGKSYDLIVEATVESGEDLLYMIVRTLYDVDAPDTNYEVAESRDGVFKNIAPSVDADNAYTVLVYNINTDECASQTVNGFKPIQPAIIPITKEELQRAVNNNKEPSNWVYRISTQGHTYEVVNHPIANLSKRVNFNSLWEDIGILGYKMEIVSVGLDSQNRLNYIKAKILNLEELGY